MAWITKYLPRKLLSRLVGILFHLKLPKPLTHLMINLFARAYKIRLDEAEKTISDYPTLGEFFVRRLKPGVRPLAPDWLVHCADSVITQAGDIHDQLLIQAKGMAYSVQDLCAFQKNLEKFQKGFFATYYLCPTDYHRVHSPLTGEVTHAKYIPGDLWPVNPWSVKNIPKLFCINERVVLRIRSEFGDLILVFVGATNVGHIELSFDATISGNQGQPPREKKYSPTVQIAKGAELGRFRMGSTVIVLLDEDLKKKLLEETNQGKVLNNLNHLVQKSVKFGQGFLTTL